MRLILLPTELLIKIFVEAARSDTTTGAALALTAKWVQEVVDPVRYHTVSLVRSRQFERFIRSDAARKKLSRHPLKRLWLGFEYSSFQVDGDDIARLLSEVTDLATFCHPDEWGGWMKLLSPQRLTLYSGIPGRYFSHLRIFQEITHLCLPQEEIILYKARAISQMGQLTHLACRIRDPVGGSVILESPKLRYFALLGSRVELDDTRAVRVPYSRFTRHDWRTKPDEFWNKIEYLVKSRRGWFRHIE